MKYRYYIIGDFDTVWGTNDEALAERVSKNDTFLVIDADKGETINMDTIGERFDVREFT